MHAQCNFHLYVAIFQQHLYMEYISPVDAIFQSFCVMTSIPCQRVDANKDSHCNLNICFSYTPPGSVCLYSSQLIRYSRACVFIYQDFIDRALLLTRACEKQIYYIYIHCSEKINFKEHEHRFVCPFSVGQLIEYSSIYCFWLPLWYPQAFLCIILSMFSLNICLWLDRNKLSIFIKWE